jgi:hypothetical protein
LHIKGKNKNDRATETESIHTSLSLETCASSFDLFFAVYFFFIPDVPNRCRIDGEGKNLIRK